ncbi:MAG: translesion error-prone DNA polymerase V autoproteolytic subunit [Chitinophagaceae bacterium]|nr:translesion error-prone DNA polymerase V autoproteolytic subunit [Chitinophagaceae bacterium]
MLVSFHDLPYLGCVLAGFPSPAADYMEVDIDLRTYLQPNSTSIFLARVQGDSMINANIPHGSIVVIDKALKPRNNSVVVASLNGDNVIKHLVITDVGTSLSPANPKYQPVPITEGMDFCVWGVVTHVIVKLTK